MKYINTFIVFLLITFSYYSSFSQSSDTTFFTIQFGERVAGYEKRWKGADGYWENYYEFNDRGRGPSIKTRFKVNENGYPIYLEAKGKNYLKNEVTEKFTVENGVAKWENDSDKGETKLTGDAFYSPTYAGGSVLLPLLIKSKTVKMLPAGEAKLILYKEYTFTVDGKPTKLFLCGVSGLGLIPSYSWSDANHQEVGSVSEWFCNVRRGFEPIIGEMYRKQKEEEDAYFKKLAVELTEKQSKGLAITNVSLFDSEKAVLIPGSAVLIKGDKIEAVGKTATLKIPKDYKVIDGKGKVLMPGMWDMHVHLSDPSESILHMAAGVTNVRDMANTTSLIDVKKKIDNDELLGPRVSWMCGFIDGEGPYTGPTGEIIDSEAEGIVAVKKYASLGYPQVKLYSSLKPEWIKGIAAEAKRNNMRVSGHIPSFMTASEAIDAGYNEIQHINMLFLNFYGKDKDTRTPLRFTLVAQEAASFDFQSQEFKDFLAKMKANNIVSDPTVAIFEEMFTSKPGSPNPIYASIKDRLPAATQRSVVQTFGGLPANGKEETHAKSFVSILTFLKAMYDSGITIVAGTDAWAGFAFHRELELYSKAGIPNNEVLKIATYNGAKVAEKLNVLGTITAGKIADMILIDGNPLQNMSDIRKVDLVIKSGSIYDPAKMYNALSILPHK